MRRQVAVLVATSVWGIRLADGAELEQKRAVKLVLFMLSVTALKALLCD